METTPKSAFLLMEMEWEAQKQTQDDWVPMGLFSSRELAEKAADPNADWYVMEMPMDRRGIK